MKIPPKDFEALCLAIRLILERQGINSDGIFVTVMLRKGKERNIMTNDPITTKELLPHVNTFSCVDNENNEVPYKEFKNEN